MLSSEEGAPEYPGEHAPMVFMALGRKFHHDNVFYWWDQKHPSFSNQTCSDNTNWETVDVCMIVAEEAIREAAGRFNDPLEFWWCTNSPRYHEEKLHTYINCPNKMDPDVVDIAKQSIQEYDQINSEMGGIRNSQGVQYGRGQTSSTTTCSMFAERRSQLSQSWNKEGLRSLNQEFICVKWLVHIPQGLHEWCVRQIFKKNDRKPRERL